MTSRSDAELLAEYARSGAEAPFAELVHRYVGLVHSAACRQVKDAQHAEDIAQAVFLLLAQKAGSLVGHPGLGGWLLNSTRYVAKAHIRSAMRRTKREQEVAMDPTTTSEATELWAQLHPHLDSALAELSATDRALVALRFFQNKSAREAAGELGLAEAAAHKRTARALDKLRLIFQRRGVTVSVTALIAIFSTQAIQAAPVGLATKLTASAIVAAKSTAATSSGWTLAKATWKLWLVSQAKTVAVVGSIVVVSATGLHVILSQAEIAQNARWQLAPINGMSDLLEKLPAQSVIVTTRAAERDPSIGNAGLAQSDSRACGVYQPLPVILGYAYFDKTKVPEGFDMMVLNGAEMRLPDGLITNRYDFFSNDPHQARAAMAGKIKQKFGLVGHWETITTNVLLLRTNGPISAQLRPGFDAVVDQQFGMNGRIKLVNTTMDSWAKRLENGLGTPVLNETGLTNGYSFAFDWPAKDKNGNFQFAEINPAMQQALGLTLVPAIRPVNILVVEKVR